jgi:uncharacterized membrane protein YhiD involved in acid resistance
LGDIVELFTSVENIDIVELGVDILLSAVMSGLVYLVFVRFGNTISNRRQFGRIFCLVAVCTTLIIAVIKSSIALSLGLVGALSIVRFRAAIKEPEELAYLFFCIAVGLGFGAGLRTITLFAALLIAAIIVVRGLVFPKTANETYNFTVNTASLSVENIVETLYPYTNGLKVRRVDNGGGRLGCMFAVEFKSLSRMESAVNELKAKDESVKVSFISNDTLL